MASRQTRDIGLVKWNPFVPRLLSSTTIATKIIIITTTTATTRTKY